MNNLRKDFNKSEEIATENSLNTKIRLLCFLKSYKDLMVLLKERTIKLEPSEVKSNKLRKISDFRMLKRVNYQVNSINTKHKFRLVIKNQRLIKSRFKNLCRKIILWVTK